MAHANTIISQILKFVPRHEFDDLAKEHHKGRAFRSASRWSQFAAMIIAQLSGRKSLRDIEENMAAQRRRLYHLGCTSLARSTLSRLNSNQPHALYEKLFAKLLHRCRSAAPGHKFRFKAPMYSLDSTSISLCLSMFPWARSLSSKGGIKLHVLLNHQGHLPEYVLMTEGKCQDIMAARSMKFPKGSLIVMDRGYADYAWYKKLSDDGVFFISRLKSHARFRVTERRKVPKGQGLICDQTIRLAGSKTAQRCPIPLRRVAYRNPEDGNLYVFITNRFDLEAGTVAKAYKERWQVELFFRFIKQNLRIKSFVGTSRNAVLTQIWIALCAYLLLSFIRFRSKLGKSLTQMLRLMQLNLFERRDLLALLRGDPPPPEKPASSLNQLVLL